jgi:hypothetical protein
MAKVLSRSAAADLKRRAAAVNAKAQGDKASATRSDDLAALDLPTIAPDQPFELAGRVLTMREYRHIEGLRLLRWAKPFVDALYAMVASGGAPPTLAQMRDLMSEHAELVRDMVAQSLTATDGYAAAAVATERIELARWSEGLNDVDGQFLLAAWWQVNTSFFFRQMFERALSRASDSPSASPSDGPGYGRAPADIGQLTARQILLFFDQAQDQERRARRARIVDINAAFAGGKAATELLKELG